MNNKYLTNLMSLFVRYMKYVPPAMRTSHAVYHANDADNRCLYNSLSIIIYGNESHAARLKLISVLNGISHMDKIIEEVIHFV